MANTNVLNYGQIQQLIGQYQRLQDQIPQLESAYKGATSANLAGRGGIPSHYIAGPLNEAKQQMFQIQRTLGTQLGIPNGQDINVDDIDSYLKQPASKAELSALPGGANVPKNATVGQAIAAGATAAPTATPTPTSTSNTSSSSDPTSSEFNLTAALQPYEQPYENMMDVLLGSKAGKAPTVAQAETAGMSQIAPYLQGLPAALQTTLVNAMRPEMAAYAGLPTAMNASVQTAAGSGLLTDLINAAKEQTMYGLGIGQATQPGSIGALQTDVRNAGSGLLPTSTFSSGLGTTGTTATAPATTSTSLPGS